MSKHVDADALLAALYEADAITPRGAKIIREFPAEDARGEWQYKSLDKFRKYEVVCSECGARYVGNYDAYDEPDDFNFCPNCGAAMNGGQDK